MDHLLTPWEYIVCRGLYSRLRCNTTFILIYYNP